MAFARLPPALTLTADVIGKLWASPVTLVGLAFGSLGWIVDRCVGARRARVTLGNNAVQFIDSPFALRGHAIALGNVILYGQNSAPESQGCYNDCAVNVGLHEKAHTYQWQVFGVLFVPIYLCAGGFSGPRRNPFERAAQAYGRGSGVWWPWRSGRRLV